VAILSGADRGTLMQFHDTEQVYETASIQALRRRAVVLDAVDIAYRVQQRGDRFALVVSLEDAGRAREELAAYDTENDDEPVVFMRRPRTHSGAWVGVLAYAAVIVLVAVLDQTDASGVDWRNAGKTQAGLIRDGQVWRCVTALTLHADAAHLIGNVVFGCLFGYFAGQMLGPGLAWLGIVLAGGAGNLLNAYLRPAVHSSLGASTAVFAALGIVAAYTWSARRQRPARGFVRWSPIIVGVILLGYLGAGGPRTDVTAHITGALSGAVLGAFFELWSERLNLTRRGEVLSGLASLGVIVAAWAVALTRL